MVPEITAVLGQLGAVPVKVVDPVIPTPNCVKLALA
jgi:hypothetical protein